MMQQNTPLLLAGVAALATLALFLRGVVLGYPRPVKESAVLSAKEQAILVAAADAFFPEGGSIPMSGTQAGVVEYFEQFLAEVPAKNRLLMRLLIRFIEHGPWVFNRTSRFTSQGPEARVRTLRSWEKSSIYFLRLSFQSLRTLFTLAFIGNDAVASQLGAVPNLSPFEARP